MRKSDPKRRGIDEVIPLRRAGELVSSLGTAFGQDLRETRLTALLGYLVAAHPEPWMHVFGFRGLPSDVILENDLDTGRSDIEVRTDRGVGVIEAKIDATDPLEQSLRYRARWRVLLTHYVPTSRQRRIRGIRFMRWGELLSTLRVLAKSPNTRARFVATDLIVYLKEHHMIKSRSTFEIYAREINNEETLSMFLHARMYGCWFEKGSRLPEALYFAPHFGQSIANAHPGVHAGISYIAKIERTEIITTWKDWQETVRVERGAAWLKKHFPTLDRVRRTWAWDGEKQRSLLLLGEPRLVFAPPIHKENLQIGKGQLSKRYYSFDDFYAAWSL